MTTRKFLTAMFIHLAIFFAALAAYRNILVPSALKFFGPSSADRIRASFQGALERDYQCLFLGNSRVYGGINPDLIPSCPGYNIAHDADSFNQSWFKIQYLIAHNKRFSTIVLSADYFDFSFIGDKKNYVYFDYFPPEYAKDYEKPLTLERIKAFATGMNSEFNRSMLISYVSPWQLLANLLIDRVVTGAWPPVSYQKPNGQTAHVGARKANGSDWVDREKEAGRLPIQVKYFHRIVDWCKENGVRLVLVTLPVRKAELDSYRPETIDGYREFFASVVDGRSVFYLDYSLNPSFTIDDFMDITHLNAQGADRFSTILSADIAKLK